MTDEQLIARVMQGDREALGPLVERYHGPLLGYLYRLTYGNRALAEDLVQETFIRILQQDSFQAGRPFKPWLYSIATHLAYDYFRTQAARRTSSLEITPDLEIPDTSPSLEEQVQTAHANLQVAEALRQIGHEYREALLLRFYGGLSLQEISEALRIPLGTVKSRLSAGTRRLRGLLLRFTLGEEP